ncbi:MAG: ParB/RepB/Spo0J family partition protein [Clostridiaceae bacterium]|nr:ParB/RepB/Spo0J family partition protein [Clostridiaceae bacterium]
MTSGKGLGKGLSALFGDEMTADTAVKGIKLREIEPNPNQPRREFDPQAMSELEESIRQNGVITPITVRRMGETYQIIAGERRWRAARSAGLGEIPAYVLDIDEREAYQLALVENLQRQDLNPIEEALGYQKLIEDFGLSQDKAGEKVGRSRPYIANSLRLLSLPEPICEMIASGALSAGHGRALVPLDEKSALDGAKIIIERELSVRDTEKMVKRLLESIGDKEGKKKENGSAIYVRELERSLSSATGHKIVINHGKKKGKLTIEYYGNDDLERVCAALNRIEKD